MTHLLLTVRFLDDRYHGLLDRGGPVEWPPSPFRLFQALVAGVARRGELVVTDDDHPDTPDNKNFTAIGQALGWLQKHSAKHPPIIIAPRHKVGQAITRFVPNNDQDVEKVRREPEKYRVAKPTIPTLFLLEPDQKPEVHYAWPLHGVKGCPVPDIEKAARSLTTLGWGIDMAFADARLAAEAELQTLKGIRWYPKKRDYPYKDTLRVPTYDADTKECTLCDLRHCHSTMVNRIEHGKPLKTVDKPKIFNRVLYTSPERPEGRPYRVFHIQCDNEERRFTYSQSKLIHIAGMVRYLAIRSMASKRLLEELYPEHDQTKDQFRDGSPPSNVLQRGHDTWDKWVKSYVSGHQSKEDKDAGLDHTQFSYVPLQSLGTEHTDPGVRRVMVVAPIGDDDWLQHLALQLDGQLLKPDPKFPNIKLPRGTRLELIGPKARDGVRDAYTRPSCTWASTTPVILNRYIEKRKQTQPDGSIVEVLDRAAITEQIKLVLAQSGIDQPCEFEWSAFSHFRKILSAHKYRIDPADPKRRFEIGYIRPNHLVGRTAVHVVIRFGRREDPNDETSRWIPATHPVPGPITIGAGRHCGFGLMAAI